MRSNCTLASICAICVGSLLAGCAGGSDVGGFQIAAAGEQPATAASIIPPAPTSATLAAPGGYILSAEEKAADCKRLKGRMKIRILQIGDHQARAKTSELSRALQSAQSQFGASATGADPDGEYARDRAMLQAYNAELASRGCATLDLTAEIKRAADASSAPSR